MSDGESTTATPGRHRCSQCQATPVLGLRPTSVVRPSGITVQKIEFEHVIASLSPEIATEV